MCKQKSYAHNGPTVFCEITGNCAVDNESIEALIKKMV